MALAAQSEKKGGIESGDNGGHWEEEAAVTAILEEVGVHGCLPPAAERGVALQDRTLDCRYYALTYYLHVIKLIGSNGTVFGSAFTAFGSCYAALFV